MNADKKVCAVVVTYNRKELLVECLTALIKQKQLNHIIVIDNNSSDGTEEYLRSKKILDNPLLNYIKLKNNTGGAGGFNAGVKMAHNEGYEWIWMMDDDVEPLPNAIPTMLKYSNISKCIHGGRVYENGEKFIFNNEFNIKTGGFNESVRNSFEQNRSYEKINFGCFEGMMIHRSIIENIGYPDKRFFIVGDDTIYGLLASKHTTPIYIKDDILIKKINKDNIQSCLNLTKNRLSNFTLYYEVRNQFLKNDYLVEHFSSSKFKLLRYTCLRSLKMLMSNIIFDRNFNSVPIIAKGFIDGMRRKLN
jgi:rhamnopyranosyl-N-acetylglucosaminyl-diphospho-decaprenol beta-1,3/1,4-galactofuranosyltransferase